MYRINDALVAFAEDRDEAVTILQNARPRGLY